VFLVGNFRTGQLMIERFGFYYVKNNTPVINESLGRLKFTSLKTYILPKPTILKRTSFSLNFLDPRL
jgi:hypothetical protein